MGVRHGLYKGFVSLMLMSVSSITTPVQRRSFFPPIVGPTIKRVSLDYQLNPDVLCAIIHQESSGNPWASRFEPKFFEKYIKGKAPKDLPGYYPPVKISTVQTEAFNRSKSFGLMQIMGNTARLYGYEGDFLDQLFDIPTNIEMGAKILSDMIKKTGSLEKALLRWNGGGNEDYPKQVMKILEDGTAHYLMRV